MNNDNPKMQEAIARFPGTFMLKANRGTYRVSPSSSYINKEDGVPMLYTEVQCPDGSWATVRRWTVRELDEAILPKKTGIITWDDPVDSRYRRSNVQERKEAATIILKDIAAKIHDLEGLPVEYGLARDLAAIQRRIEREWED